MNESQEATITVTMMDCGEVLTYSKSFEESPDVVKVFEAFLRAYETFGYLNDVDVSIGNKVFGESSVTFSKDSGVQSDCPLQRYIDNYENR